MVRCPHCFGFVTVPGDEMPQFKASAPAPASEPAADSDAAAPAEPAHREPEPKPATIVFRCHYCQSRMETDVANAGLPCLCPGCRASLIVPGYAQPIFLPHARRRAPASPSDLPRPPRDHVGAGILLALAALTLLWMAVNWLRSLM